MNSIFNYFQISVLFTFTLLFIARIIYMRRVKKTSAITFTLNSKETSNILTVSMSAAICAFVAVLVIHVFHPEINFQPLALNILIVETVAAKVAGMVMVSVGLLIYIVAMFTLADYWRVGDAAKQTRTLVTRGIYSLSRNPIYIFFVLYFLGTFLINGILIFLIFTIMMALNAHYLIIEEEKFLLKSYGSAFQKYCAATGRYVTWRPIGSKISKKSAT
jgi:protein-S-isoprenylcysteine O-methyltransferase Ste14